MTDNYHNMLAGNSADQLRAYIKRILKIEEEIAEINDGKGKIYKEAKACGFCRKTLRKVVRRQSKGRETVQEEDEMLELYEAALASTDQINE